VKRFAVRLLGVTTALTVIGATFAATSFAGGGPFMPCCFNPSTGIAKNMSCCLVNFAMQCCNRFVS